MPYVLLDDAQPTKPAQPQKGYVLLDDAPREKAVGEDSSLVGFGAGLGKGVGTVALNAQRYLGKGINAVADLISPPERNLTSVITGQDNSGTAAGRWLVKDAEQGLQNLKSEVAPYKAASPIATGAGELGGEIAATLPVGGALGQVAKLGARALPAASPVLTPLAESLASSGFRTGATQGGLQNLATRVVGGAATGGASGALVDPESAGTSALIGGALPPVLKGVGAGARYAGNVAGSLVKPFTTSGQEEIANRVLRKFAEGGPTEINAAEIIPGSTPTLAAATANPGIATLERVARDVRPNAFIEREQANAAARNNLLSGITQDRAAVESAIANRDQVANALYGKAFDADAMRQSMASEAQKTRAPFAGVGLSAAREDLATPGLRELASRPLFQSAIEDAKKLAANNGVDIGDPLQSLQGLHYIKLALDDSLNPQAKSAMGRNASNAVMSMRDKLADELEKVAPSYGSARAVYSEMSKPINAMEALQGLNLTDVNGNITLAKVSNAIDKIERESIKPGANNFKAITDEQLNVLRSIKADLARQSNTQLGRSAGSNTFQNLATNNILESAGGKLLSSAADRTGISGIVGQVGKLAYGNSNEAIRDRLINLLLSPQNAVLKEPERVQASNKLMELLRNQGGQAVTRAAPILGAQ